MPKDVRRLEIPNDTACLADVRDFVRSGILAGGFPEACLNQVLVAVDEAITNIIEHGYDGRRQGNIVLQQRVTDHEYAVVIEDDATPYDPTGRSTDIDLQQHVAEGRSGGLGLVFLTRVMDRIDHQSLAPSGNRLSLCKRVPAE